MTVSPTRESQSLGLVSEISVPTGAEAHAFDLWAIQELGVSQPVLMENAGRAAAQVLMRCYPEGPVVVLVGSGNNGGDGWVLGRTLHAWGRTVHVLVVGSDRPQPLRHGWDVPRSAFGDESDRVMAGAAVIVDALLGTGLRGVPRDLEAGVIEKMSGAAKPILSLDIPSGVNADTGLTPGIALRADVTVTFGSPKLGLLLSPGRLHAGRIVTVEIGFPPAGGRLGLGTTLTTAWATTHRPRRPPVTHKKAVGSLLIVAGDHGMAGAAILATRAALRAGVGLVRVASDASNREVLQAAVPEALFVNRADPEAVRVAARASQAWVLGPGYGVEAARAAELRPLLDLPTAVVVMDADALTLVAEDLLPPLSEWGGRHDLVVTPHLGELRRLAHLGESTPDHARLQASLELASSWNATVLAKGSPSMIAAADGAFLVDILGSSDLATAGMGDALAGVIGAYGAQGTGAFVSAALALHDTACAHRAVALGPSLTPSDVIDGLPRVLQASAKPSPLGLDFVTLDVEPTW